MNLEEARENARAIASEEYLDLDVRRIDMARAAATDVLDLADEVERLHSDLADWWKMSRGGVLGEGMEHLANLMDEHGITREDT